jgi:hypothetical protein
MLIHHFVGWLSMALMKWELHFVPKIGTHNRAHPIN